MYFLDLKSLRYAVKSFRLFLLICLIICLPHSIQTQIILTEIMFDADTLEAHNEFVEILNIGHEEIMLDSLKVGDDSSMDFIIDAGYGLELNPGQFAVIMDGSYFGNSDTYDSIIPKSALIVKIDDASFGSFGWSNSKPETVFLIDAFGATIQSYQYTLDNDPGISDEKMILNQDNTEYNWGNSLIIRGTPGRGNSISPFQWDLAIDSAWSNPKYPIQDSLFQIKIVVKNAGLNSFSTFSMDLFEDLNNNYQIDDDEFSQNIKFQKHLSYTDTVWLTASVDGLNIGYHHFGLILHLDDDQNMENNKWFITLQVEAIDIPIVINEIMFKPNVGQSEWIELYNYHNFGIELENWSFSDLEDTVKITEFPYTIGPKSYSILSGDISIMSQFALSPETVLLIKNFPTLNNDLDELKIISSSGRLVDWVNYSDTWLRREAEAGVSLERISPTISSSLANNWSASVSPDGGTPAKQNSIFIKKPVEESLITIAPNPFSPDRDGFEDFAIIEYSLPFATGWMTLDIFDINGRFIRRLANQLAVGQNGHLIWDGADQNNRVSRIGLYIILLRIYEPNSNLFQELKKTIVLTKR